MLVPEAEERLAVAVIRSLGQAGYVVHACSTKHYAMGWGSRFAKHAARCPKYSSADYVRWLREYCARYAIRCIVPSEDLLLAIRPAYEEFAPLLPIGSDPVLVYASISKYELFHRLLGAQSGDAANRPDANLPAVRLVTSADPIPNEAELHSLGLPLYVKTDAMHARSSNASASVGRAATIGKAYRLVRDSLTTHDRAVIQGAVPGVGVGAFVLRWNGRVLARFMHLRLHELPGTGWSSYRTSWWHPEIIADAEAKLEHLDFHGVAMMEYRWDPATDAFRLLEMNARFWGSLHLALYAGIDFPRLLVDAFLGHTVEPAPEPQSGVRCRNVALDVRYVWSRLRGDDVGLGQKLWAIPKFLLLSLNPRIKSDLWYPGDAESGGFSFASTPGRH